MGQDSIRGIFVNHWRSCYKWPGGNLTYSIDYYFSSTLIHKSSMKVKFRLIFFVLILYCVCLMKFILFIRFFFLIYVFVLLLIWLDWYCQWTELGIPPQASSVCLSVLRWWDLVGLAPFITCMISSTSCPHFRMTSRPFSRC